MHGRTDFGIFSELLESNGVDSDQQNLKRLCERYFSILPQQLAERQGQILPGVPEILRAFDRDEATVNALLTGNMARSAQIKLEHYGLWEFFAFGVFGDFATHRKELAGPALETVASNHQADECQTPETIIIGDTPMDVELAQVMNVRCLAVCTGGFSEAELCAAGADLVLNDLSDPESVYDWCLSSGEQA